MSFDCGNDSPSITLSLDTDGKLIADLNLSGDSGNAAEVRSDGLYVPGGSFVNVMPGDPGNGDVAIYLADDTNGIEWAFKYRAASPSIYKWEFIGGGWARADIDDIEVMGGSAVAPDYINIPGGTVGPQWTVPLEGDYEIEFGCLIDGALIGTGTAASLRLGAVPAVFADAVASYDDHFESVARRRTFEAVPAGTLIKMQYTKNDDGDAQFGHRFLRIQPIRVLGS